MQSGWRPLIVVAAGGLVLLMNVAACSSPSTKTSEREARKAEETAAAQGTVKGPSVHAVLESVSGEVSVKRAAGDAWVSASERMELFENDKVRTARGASAELRFTSGSVMAVGEDALLGIAETRPSPGQEPTDVTVIKGRIDAELSDPGAQSLSVSTPGATVRAGREIVFQ